VLTTVNTDASGVFQAAVPEGPLKIEISQTGYITQTKLIDVQGNIAVGQGIDMSVSQELPSDALRVVLTWGEKPDDLDSHVYFGRNMDTHVWHQHRSDTAAETGGLHVSLDRDATGGKGPEAVTITNIGKCTKKGNCLLKFVVENSARNTGPLSNSAGVITIYKGTKLDSTFEIPKEAGYQRWWTVFTMDCTEGASGQIYEGEKAYGPYLSAENLATANWKNTMPGANTWSMVPNKAMMTGLLTKDKEELSAIESAQYVTLSSYDGGFDCQNVDWSGNSGLKECPAGHYLKGLKRGKLLPDDASEVVTAKCCKPKNMPAQWGTCFEQDLFSNTGDMSSCAAQDGELTAMVGLVKDKMMTKLTLGSHPHMLGFEQLERLLERTAKTGNEGYPPFNIEQTSDRGYRITLAVAGFAEEDLSITVEDRQLVIRGRQRDDSSERVYLHRGIAARQFQRSFVLAEGVDVGDATMENGLLHIDLTQVMPETIVQTIKIKQG
jgi:HSP20 family molecular chaperone IbpA